MEIEQEREVADAMHELYSSPITPYFIPTKSLVTTMPELSLDGLANQSTGQGHPGDVMSNNIENLIQALHRSMPVKRFRKNRVKLVEPTTSKTNKKIDSPIQILPRLRSQTRQRRRRNSMTFTYTDKARRASIDSIGAISEPGPDDYYDYSQFGALVGDKIGAYSIEQRKDLIKKYLKKRKTRVWRKKIKYKVRKTFADSRLRVKGRFISKQDEAKLREAILFAF